MSIKLAWYQGLVVVCALACILGGHLFVVQSLTVGLHTQVQSMHSWHYRKSYISVVGLDDRGGQWAVALTEKRRGRKEGDRNTGRWG